MFMLFTAAATAATCLSDPAALLNAYRVAAGDESGRSTVTSEYRVDDSGIAGRETSIVDTATGRYAERSRSGPIFGGTGFDGRTAWARDITGWYSPQSGGNKREQAINQAYRNANEGERTAALLGSRHSAATRSGSRRTVARHSRHASIPSAISCNRCAKRPPSVIASRSATPGTFPTAEQ